MTRTWEEEDGVPAWLGAMCGSLAAGSAGWMTASHLNKTLPWRDENPIDEDHARFLTADPRHGPQIMNEGPALPLAEPIFGLAGLIGGYALGRHYPGYGLLAAGTMTAIYLTMPARDASVSAYPMEATGIEPSPIHDAVAGMVGSHPVAGTI